MPKRVETIIDKHNQARDKYGNTLRQSFRTPQEHNRAGQEYIDSYHDLEHFQSGRAYDHRPTTLPNPKQPKKPKG